ncbi:hypothetical protein BD777DRAFT_18566 [Yarrowia lipolytica]|nr:hypothetical protein BD777DRAFT_18566 [Yarrowia lipolytica]
MKHFSSPSSNHLPCLRGLPLAAKSLSSGCLLVPPRALTVSISHGEGELGEAINTVEECKEVMLLQYRRFSWQ